MTPLVERNVELKNIEDVKELLYQQKRAIIESIIPSEGKIALYKDRAEILWDMPNNLPSLFPAGLFELGKS